MILNSNRPLSIVIADDDADDQFLFQQALKEFKFEHDFHAVNDGIQLMDLLLHRGKFETFSDFKPDVILLDLNMPLLDGFNALSQIKATDHLKDIPTFILSTSRSSHDVERSLALGATGFYSKPAEFSKLKNIVAEIFTTAPVKG